MVTAEEAPPAVPLETPEAMQLLARAAEIETTIARIAIAGAAKVAKVKDVAEAAIAPLAAEAAELRGRLEPWWLANRDQLAGKGKKSAQLAGLDIGTRLSRATLEVDGSEDELTEQLRKARWAEGLVRTKHDLDRVAILAALKGSLKERLKKLGFKASEQRDVFFVALPKPQGGRA